MPKILVRKTCGSVCLSDKLRPARNTEPRAQMLTKCEQEKVFATLKTYDQKNLASCDILWCNHKCQYLVLQYKTYLRKPEDVLQRRIIRQIMNYRQSRPDPSRTGMIQQSLSDIFFVIGKKFLVWVIWLWSCVNMCLNMCVSLNVILTGKGEKENLMSYRLQKLGVLMITWPLTTTLAMARRRREIQYLPDRHCCQPYHKILVLWYCCFILYNLSTSTPNTHTHKGYMHVDPTLSHGNRPSLLWCILGIVHSSTSNEPNFITSLLPATPLDDTKS